MINYVLWLTVSANSKEEIVRELANFGEQIPNIKAPNHGALSCFGDGVGLEWSLKSAALESAAPGKTISQLICYYRSQRTNDLLK